MTQKQYQIHLRRGNQRVIPFLDFVINRQPDKTVKIQVYRKPTHTDQYLHFKSHHPMHHIKSGVVRTLMDRKDTLVSTEDDKDREELHIRNALKSCSYPKWIFDKVKHDQCQKRNKNLAIANRSRVSCAHNTLRASI